jgi:hypothetical protein
VNVSKRADCTTASWPANTVHALFYVVILGMAASGIGTLAFSGGSQRRSRSCWSASGVVTGMSVRYALGIDKRYIRPHLVPDGLENSLDRNLELTVGKQEGGQRDKTARVHIAAWRCGRVAARDEPAEYWQDGQDWIYQPRVWPSGTALATARAPMVPPAPGRFSITNSGPAFGSCAEQSSAPECRCPRRKRHHDHNGTRRIGLSHRRPGRGHHDRRCREARDE